LKTIKTAALISIEVTCLDGRYIIGTSVAPIVSKYPLVRCQKYEKWGTGSEELFIPYIISL